MRCYRGKEIKIGGDGRSVEDLDLGGYIWVPCYDFCILKIGSRWSSMYHFKNQVSLPRSFL